MKFVQRFVEGNLDTFHVVFCTILQVDIGHVGCVIDDHIFSSLE